MYAYICVYTYICVCAHVYLHRCANLPHTKGEHKEPFTHKHTYNLYVCLCVCTYIHLRVRTCVHIQIWIYTKYRKARRALHTQKCVYTFVYTRVNIYMCVCVHVLIYRHTCISSTAGEYEGPCMRQYIYMQQKHAFCAACANIHIYVNTYICMCVHVLMHR